MPKISNDSSELIEQIVLFIAEAFQCRINFKYPIELARPLLCTVEVYSKDREKCIKAFDFAERLFNSFVEVPEDIFFSFMHFYRRRQYEEREQIEPSLIRTFRSVIMKNKVVKLVPVSIAWECVKRTLKHFDSDFIIPLSPKDIESLSCHINLASAYIEFIDSLEPKDILDCLYDIHSKTNEAAKNSASYKSFHLGRIVCFNFIKTCSLIPIIEMIKDVKYKLTDQLGDLFNNLLLSLTVMLGQFDEDLRSGLCKALFNSGVIHAIIQVTSNGANRKVLKRNKIHRSIQRFLHKLVCFLIKKENCDLKESRYETLDCEITLDHDQVVKNLRPPDYKQLYYYLAINYHSIKFGSKFFTKTELSAVLNRFYSMQNDLKNLDLILVKYLTYVTAFLSSPIDSDTSLHAFNDMFVNYWKISDSDVIAKTLSTDLFTLNWCMQSEDFMSRAGKCIIKSAVLVWSNSKDQGYLQTFIDNIARCEKVSFILADCLATQKEATMMVKQVLLSEVKTTDISNLTQKLMLSIPDILCKNFVEREESGFDLKSIEQMNCLIDLLCLSWEKQTALPSFLRIDHRLLEWICLRAKKLYLQEDECSIKTLEHFNKFFKIILDYDRTIRDLELTNYINSIVIHDMKNLCANFNGQPSDSARSTASYLYKLRLHQTTDPIQWKNAPSGIDSTNIKYHLDCVTKWLNTDSIEMIELSLILLRDILNSKESSHGLYNEFLSSISCFIRILCFNQALIDNEIVTEIFEMLMIEKKELSHMIRYNPLLNNLLKSLGSEIRISDDLSRAKKSCVILNAILNESFDNPIIKSTIKMILHTIEKDKCATINQPSENDPHAIDELMKNLCEKLCSYTTGRKTKSKSKYKEAWKQPTDIYSDGVILVNLGDAPTDLVGCPNANSESGNSDDDNENIISNSSEDIIDLESCSRPESPNSFKSVTSYISLSGDEIEFPHILVDVDAKHQVIDIGSSQEESSCSNDNEVESILRSCHLKPELVNERLFDDLEDEEEENEFQAITQSLNLRIFSDDVRPSQDSLREAIRDSLDAANGLQQDRSMNDMNRKDYERTTKDISASLFMKTDSMSYVDGIGDDQLQIWERVSREYSQNSQAKQ